MFGPRVLPGLRIVSPNKSIRLWDDHRQLHRGVQPATCREMAKVGLHREARVSQARRGDLVHLKQVFCLADVEPVSALPS